MKKILITGCNGLLGQKLVYQILNDKKYQLIATAIGTNRIKETKGYIFESLDITNQKQVLEMVKKHKPDFIINTAAMTNVDACEDNKEKCIDLNVNAVKYLVEACQQNNCHLIHLSTDFIFDGENGPYKETDKPNPLSLYGQSKLDSEKIIQHSSIKWTIVRTIIIYGIVEDMSRSNIVLWTKNSLEKNQTINVVTDQFRSPTLAEDLAIGCLLIADKNATGIYHLSGPETFSIIDLAYQVADFYHLDKSLIHPLTSQNLNQAAKRPLKTGFILDKAYQELGFKPKTFAEGISILNNQLKEMSKKQSN
jgi:dTDP-4-dehydrorhamnose reductase